MAAPKFEVVQDAPEPEDNSRAADLLLLSLKALSQRALVALESLFTLITVALGFWLWSTVMPEPSVNQLIGLAIFAVFVLAANVIVRRYK